jgi:ribosomal protein S18 acetylase RimI-like enzyme
MKIRLATIADLDELEWLEDNVFVQDRYHRAQLRYLLSEAYATTHVAVEGAQIVGWAIMLWKRKSHVGHLHSLGVRREWQGHGIGPKLLDLIEAEATERGCDRVSLYARATNEQAIRVYSRRGYETVKVIKDYFVDGGTGLRMMKHLKEARL